jgi:hypothetical protein
MPIHTHSTPRAHLSTNDDDNASGERHTLPMQQVVQRVRHVLEYERERVQHDAQTQLNVLMSHALCVRRRVLRARTYA